MKRNLLILAIISLLAVAGASAQKPANFSGHWELDTSKSKLEGRRIEAMTLNVVQTAKDIKVDTKTTRAPRPADAPATNPTGAPGGMGRGFGGVVGGGDSSFTYTLDGKETTAQQDGPMGPMPVKLSGRLDSGKLNLSTVRTFSGPNGEISISSKDTWSLSPDGGTLTVSREQSSPRGTTTTELVFVKK